MCLPELPLDRQQIYPLLQNIHASTSTYISIYKTYTAFLPRVTWTYIFLVRCWLVYWNVCQKLTRDERQLYFFFCSVQLSWLGEWMYMKWQVGTTAWLWNAVIDYSLMIDLWIEIIWNGSDINSWISLIILWKSVNMYDMDMRDWCKYAIDLESWISKNYVDVNSNYVSPKEDFSWLIKN